jgi:hypothetical protein
MRIFFSIIIILLMTLSLFAEETFIYDAKGKRDPFVSLALKDGSYISDAYGIKGVNDIRLEGIVWDRIKGSIAIVNGEIVKEGEEIGSLKLLKIEEKAVVFDVDGNEVRVDLILE